jgi:DNA polymerase-3 subunit beta
MKFIINSDILADALQIGVPVISKKKPDIISGMLFRLNKTALTITSTSIEVRIVSSINVKKAAGGGQFILPEKTVSLLIRLLKIVRSELIQFHINEETLNATVHYKTGSYNFICEANISYPEEQPLDTGQLSTLKIPENYLLNVISRCNSLSMNDPLRPIMNGIYFDIYKDHVTFVASNGFCLVKLRNNLLHSNTERSFVLSNSAAVVLKSLLNNNNNNFIKILFDDNFVKFYISQTVITVRRPKGDYPKYNSAITALQSNPFRITLNRLDAVNLISHLLSPYRSHHALSVKLTFTDTDNSLICSINTQNLPDVFFLSNCSSSEEKISCIYEYDRKNNPQDILFHASHLLNAIKSILSEDVTLEMSDKQNKGTIIRPSKNEENEVLTILIMPVSA